MNRPERSRWSAARPAPARGQSDPEVLDIKPQVVDLVLTVVSLDESVSTSESEDQVEVRLRTDVLFAFDTAALRPAARSRIDEAAAGIRREKPSRVRVDGHTDSKGSSAYNQRLSERRAAAVAGALRRQLGPAAPALVVSGQGESDPVAPNTRKDGRDNPRGRARNRRVTVRFGR